MILKRIKHKPGNVIQRFGNWRKDEPQVLIENQKWLDLGKPDEVELIIEHKKDKTIYKMKDQLK